MSGLRSVLEAALRENSDDLAAHMAYGDHLAESGDPRGEFIQVQLALEVPKLRPAQRASLKEREAALLAAHHAEWLGPLGQHDTRYSPMFQGIRWERGWITELVVPRLDVRAAQALLAAPLPARILRRLDIRRNPIITLNSPDYALLPAEAVDPGQDSSALALLHGAAFLPCLRSLRVGQEADPAPRTFPDLSTAQGLAGLVAQTNSKPGHESQLEELRVHCDGLDYQRLFRLSLPALTTLELIHGTYLHRLSILAANPGLPRLEALRIVPILVDGAFPVSLREIGPVLESPHFPRLRELCLDGAQLGDEGCRRLVRSGILKRLRVLELRRCDIGEAGAKALAWCADSERLDRLDLRGNPINKAGISVLKDYHIKVLFDYEQEATFEDDME
jgi:uncharacterized protein (TIGR02996 family)